jgi:hypothetical protein
VPKTDCSKNRAPSNAAIPPSINADEAIINEGCATNRVLPSKNLKAALQGITGQARSKTSSVYQETTYYFLKNLKGLFWYILRVWPDSPSSAQSAPYQERLYNSSEK